MNRIFGHGTARNAWWVAPAVTLAGIAGYRIVHASEEAPTAAVSFSGVLEEGGALVTGQRQVALQFFADPGGATPLCAATVTAASVSGGFFSVPASAECIAAVSKRRESYYQITVDSTVLPVTQVPSNVSTLRSETDFRGARLTRRTIRGADGSLWSDTTMYDTQLGIDCLYSTVKNGAAVELRCVPEGGTASRGVGGQLKWYLDATCTQPLPAGARVGSKDPGYLIDRDPDDDQIVTAIFRSTELGAVYEGTGLPLPCSPNGLTAWGKGAAVPFEAFVLGTAFP